MKKPPISKGSPSLCSPRQQLEQAATALTNAINVKEAQTEGRALTSVRFGPRPGHAEACPSTK